MRALVAAAALLPVLASAQARYDHRGALGLTAALGAEAVTAAGLNQAGDTGARFPLELGGTLSVTDHSELRLSGRLAPSATRALAGALFAGVRNSFGREQWKTFFDLELAVHLAPLVVVGARGAFGLQYDFLPVMGAYVSLGGQLAGGAGLRLGFEALLGVQLRTYILEG